MRLVSSCCWMICFTSLDHVRSYQSMDTYIGRTLLKVEPLKKRLVPIIRELAR